MSTISWRGWIWRTALTLALITDYFLFSTGNPSLSYSLLGGWFEVPLALAVILTAGYASQVIRKRQPGKAFLLYAVVVTAGGIALFLASGSAREHAADRMDVLLNEILKEPNAARTSALPESRELAARVSGEKHTVRREAFIPTFRRADYQLRLENGEQFQVVMVLSWRGVPEIVLRKSGVVPLS